MIAAATGPEGLPAWAGPAALVAIGLGLAALLGLAGWRLRRGPRPWTLADAALALALLLWGSVGGGLGFHRLLAGDWFWTGEAPVLPALAGTASGALVAAAFAAARAGLAGLGLGRPPWRATLLAPLLVGPFLLLTALWTTLVEALGVPVEEQRLLELLREGPVDPALAAVLIYGVLVAPLFEEVLFRGFLVPPLARRWGAVGAIAGTAVAFGLLHGADPSAVVPLTGLGALLAWLRLRTGSLWPAIALHLGNNAFAALAVLAGLPPPGG